MVTNALDARAAELKAEGSTVVYVTADGQALGLLAVADRIKPEALTVVAALRRGGLQVAMGTGDAERTAQAVAFKWASRTSTPKCCLRTRRRW